MPQRSPSAARNVPGGRGTVRRIMQEHFGSKPVRMTRQGGGLSNHVFLVEQDSGEFIVRLNPHRAKRNVFLKEQWATAHARRVGVPVPEIMAVGDNPVPYMILRKSPGEPVTECADRVRIMRELGRIAARINSILTHGFGGNFDWSRNGLRGHLTWPEFLRLEIKLDSRLQVLRRLRMMPARQIESIRKILESAGQGRSPALNHGDLRAKNVLVDKRGRISAILDWENCSSTLAPEWELSLALHDLSIDEKQEFLRGYGVSTDAVSRIAPLVKALNLINYVPHIERLERRKDLTQVEFLRVRFSGALDLYGS